jgi:hypothetical protein
LHDPLAQLVTDGVGHWPLALHVAAAVTRPAVHDRPAPHVVPDALFVVSLHTCVPVLQEYVPFLQRFGGLQGALAVHALHEPLKQTRFVPHPVPFGTFIPVSVQTGAPVVQESVPPWHLFDGVQASPLLQVTHAPALLQTIPVPHAVPAALLAVASHTGDPVVHAIAPLLQGSVGWHVAPVVHETQLPARQTRFVPQAVPSATATLLSVHVGVPVEQLSVPV